jgi:hypothetical protein
MIEKQFELFQTLIDRCAKHDYDVLREALSLKKAYLSAEQFPDYIRKEIFRITEELVSINQQVPALKTFAFDWHIPNFIWESSFFENLTVAERKKYIAFPYESFDDRLYTENQTSYDEALPYFSVIIKLGCVQQIFGRLTENGRQIITPASNTLHKPKNRRNKTT